MVKLHHINIGGLPMKRCLVCFLLIFFVFIFSTNIAFAVDPIDFASFTDDELLVLQAQITAEIESRGLTDKKVNQLSSGSYVVGTDIPAGSYTFRKIPGDDYTAVLYVYNSDDLENSVSSGSASESGCMLNLQEGQILRITWTAVNASKFVPLEW